MMDGYEVWKQEQLDKKRCDIESDYMFKNTFLEYRNTFTNIMEFIIFYLFLPATYFYLNYLFFNSSLKPYVIIFAITLFLVYCVVGAFVEHYMTKMYYEFKYYRHIRNKIVFKNQKSKELYIKHPNAQLRIYIKKDEDKYIIYDKSTLNNNSYDYTCKIGDYINILDLIYIISIGKHYSEEYIENKVKEELALYSIELDKQIQEDKKQEEEIEDFNKLI